MADLIIVRGSHPPSIIRLGGKAWACAGQNWVPCPYDTKLDDLVWDRDPPWDKYKDTFQKTEIIKTIKGSKGDNYKVSYINGVWNCECHGFMFRRKCKHIEQVKNLLQENGTYGKS
jgi:hypothetical protein